MPWQPLLSLFLLSSVGIFHGQMVEVVEHDAHHIPTATTCPQKGPICTDPLYRYIIQPTTLGNSLAELKMGCLTPGVGQWGWGYFRATKSSPLSLQANVADDSADLQMAVWGPFSTPSYCGSTLGTPLWTYCSPPLGALSTSPTTSTFLVQELYYYIVLLNTIGGSPGVKLVTITEADTISTECNLLLFYSPDSIVGRQLQTSMKLEGQAVHVPGVEVGVMPGTAGCAAPPLAVYTVNQYTSTAVIDTSGLTGSYLLCLKNATGQYSTGLAFPFEVRSWYFQPALLQGQANAFTVTVAGTQVQALRLVAIVPHGTSCSSNDTVAGAFLLTTTRTFTVQRSDLLPGPYRVCFQYQDHWWPELSADLTLSTPFYLTSPKRRTVGQSFNATLEFAGDAVTSTGRHQLALLFPGDDCANAATQFVTTAVSQDSSPLLFFDLSKLPPGKFIVCYRPAGQSFSQDMMDFLNILDFRADRPFIVATLGQSIAFQGTQIAAVGNHVALVSDAMECDSRPLLVVTPMGSVSLNASALAPGLYKWCLQNSMGLSVEISLAILPQQFNVEPLILAQTVRAQMKLSAPGLLPWSWSMLTIVPSALDCLTAPQNPLDLAQVLPMASGTGPILVEWDLHNLGAGQYVVCAQTSQSPVHWHIGNFTLIDLRVRNPFITAINDTAVLEGKSILGLASKVKILPWASACESESPVTNVPSAPGIIRVPISMPVGQELRICVQDIQTKLFRSGLEVFLKVTPGFQLASTLLAQNAIARLQVEGTGLTGKQDELAIVPNKNCSEAPLLQGTVTSPFNLSVLPPGTYYACLRPAGVVAGNLSQLIQIEGFMISPSVAPSGMMNLTIGGDLVAGGSEYIAILDSQSDCTSAGPLEFAVPTSQTLEIDLRCYVPGLYKVCLRTPAQGYMSHLFVNLHIISPFIVTPQLFARSAASQMSFGSTLAGTLRLVPQPGTCRATWGVSKWKKTVVAQSTVTADFTAVPGGSYWLCLHQQPIGELNNNDDIHGAGMQEMAVAIVDLQLTGSCRSVQPTYDVHLQLIGTQIGSSLGEEVAVIPEHQSCSLNAPNSSLRGPLRAGAIALDLSSLACGLHRVCFRDGSSRYLTFQDGLEVALHVYGAVGPTFFPSSILAATPQTLTVHDRGVARFNTQSGGDRLRLVVAKDTVPCADTQSAEQSIGLSPDNMTGSTFINWMLTVAQPGQYHICYKAAGQVSWAQLEPPLTVFRGIFQFTGQDSPSLEAQIPQLMTVNTTAQPASFSGRRTHFSAALDEVAFIMSHPPWQLPGGGCGVGPYVVGPSLLSDGALILTFPMAGIYTMCFRPAGAAAFFPVKTFFVATPGCAIPAGGSLVPRRPCSDKCDRCADEWWWLWPAILFPFVGALLLIILWLLLCPKGRYKRLKQHFSKQRDQSSQQQGEEWLVLLGDLPLQGNVLNEEMEHILIAETEEMKAQLEELGLKLEELKEAGPPPPQIYRIEIPVEHTVEVPVVHIKEEVVEVEKLVTVQIPKIVEEETVKEVEKEVISEKEVLDPTTGLHLQWAEEDIKALRQALGDITAQLEQVQLQLQALGPRPVRARTSRPTSSSANVKK